ncbi:HAD-IA family hydrolase [Cohnella sp. CFH 77786]|uniref:HAD family hydrolase n=1 Tax=Cohnella sp. CFH 77786 TaxID=2662265 RepID=UPI001C608735|nr:HAD family hydrolase [Cohnella sp. CFH 77786]MBW5448293.1 HAD-IA family hydrolase [Cohnella sp. CFH 77786]
MIKAVIFDFDGTLLDSESCAFEAFGDMYKEHGHELALEKWALCIGTADGPFDPYEDLQTKVGRKLERETLKARFEEELLARALRAELRPGVPGILEEARRLGLSIGLASSSVRTWIDRHLTARGIRGYFETIKTSDDVEKVKPDPALYRLALEALGVRPDEAVAVEDSLNGMRAAKAAGMQVVIVPNPVTRQMDFAAEGPDLILDSLAERPLTWIVDRLESARQKT